MGRKTDAALGHIRVKGIGRAAKGDTLCRSATIASALHSVYTPQAVCAHAGKEKAALLGPAFRFVALLRLAGGLQHRQHCRQPLIARNRGNQAILAVLHSTQTAPFLTMTCDSNPHGMCPIHGGLVHNRCKVPFVGSRAALWPYFPPCGAKSKRRQP